MVACRKKMTAGWVGTLAVYDGFHVGSAAWPAASYQ